MYGDLIMNDRELLNKDVQKVIRTIYSCNNTIHLKGASNLMDNFFKKWKNKIKNLDINFCIVVFNDIFDKKYKLITEGYKDV